jgi:hypothetical protein
LEGVKERDRKRRHDPVVQRVEIPSFLCVDQDNENKEKDPREMGQRKRIIYKF